MGFKNPLPNENFNLFLLTGQIRGKNTPKFHFKIWMRLVIKVINLLKDTWFDKRDLSDFFINFTPFDKYR